MTIVLDFSLFLLHQLKSRIPPQSRHQPRPAAAAAGFSTFPFVWTCSKRELYSAGAT